MKRLLTSRTSLLSLACCLVALGAVAASAAPPTPKDLLLDARARAAFAAKHVKAMVLVHYHPPLAPRQDPKYRTPLEVRAFVVNDGGTPRVLAPVSHVLGATWVELELFDGRRVGATIRPPAGKPEDIPLLELVPKTPLKGVLALDWADKKTPVEGLRVWGVELSGTRLPGARRIPILIDSVLGKPVEYPLERFFYSGIGGIDGQPLLTHRGKVACVVFRRVPGTTNISLCTPAAAALQVPPREKPRSEKFKLNTFGRKPLDR